MIFGKKNILKRCQISWNWCHLVGKHDFGAKFGSRAKIDSGGGGHHPLHLARVPDVALIRVKRKGSLHLLEHLYQAGQNWRRRQAILLEAWLPLCSNTTNNFSRHEMSSISSGHIAPPPLSHTQKNQISDHKAIELCVLDIMCSSHRAGGGYTFLEWPLP